MSWLNIDTAITSSIVGIIVGVVGTVIGYYAAKTSFGRPTYSIKNATDLLTLGRIEEWNGLRLLNREWIPSLSSINLAKLRLNSIDLRNVTLDNINLSDTFLENANFANASAKNTDFTHARLTGANFSGANLEGAKFNGAVLERASFKGARLKGTRFENADLRDAAFDDTALSSNLDVSPSQKEALKQNRANLIDRIRRESAQVSRDPELWEHLTWVDFENIVADILRNAGYRVERVGTKGGPDNGIDMIAEKKDVLGDVVYAVQAKFASSNRPIGSTTVQALVGAKKQSPQYDKFLLITNGRFTNGARFIASEDRDIELIDREKLQDLIEQESSANNT